jgi:D-lyxose ketol-isomerase
MFRRQMMALSSKEYEEARNRALSYLEKVKIVLTERERETLEVADFGLGELSNYGVELVTYLNTERVCAKEVVLFPFQICPEHYHPPNEGDPGKEETFRCRWGLVYLYVEGPETKNPKARIPLERRPYFTCWHEVVLNPGDQYLVEAGRVHWFQAGPEGAVLSEFSTPSTDEFDVFTDPGVKRIPEIIY